MLQRPKSTHKHQHQGQSRVPSAGSLGHHSQNQTHPRSCSVRLCARLALGVRVDVDVAVRVAVKVTVSRRVLACVCATRAPFGRARTLRD